jgi:hypothetical protein
MIKIDNMKKIYNDDSDCFADWTLRKLKDEARSYDQMIHEVGCYGMSDLKNNSGILAELDRRGVEMFSRLTFN